MLKVNNIEVAYLGVIRVLHGVSLEVGDGKIVALIGANGGGKTTTLKAISGLLQTEQGEISSGDIIFNDRTINQIGPEDIARLGISQVMEGRRVLAHLSVEENLYVGAYRRNDKAGIKSDLEMVFNYFPKIKDFRRRTSGYLSGGEQQMLVIGRALMADPRLMLLDEPSLGLAPLIIREIFRIIKNLNEEGLTILLVEQNARKALQYARKAYVLEIGQMILEGDPTSLLSNRQFYDAYLGSSAHQE